MTEHKMLNPRRYFISHAQGDSDVVERGGGQPTRFIKSFSSDAEAQAYINTLPLLTEHQQSEQQKQERRISCNSSPTGSNAALADLQKGMVEQ